MTWRLIWTKRAERELRRLDATTIRRIGGAASRYAETERGDVKPLRGSEPEWRLRVGDWRVLLTFDPATNTMIVLRVLPRGRAYRD